VHLGVRNRDQGVAEQKTPKEKESLKLHDTLGRSDGWLYEIQEIKSSQIKKKHELTHHQHRVQQENNNWNKKRTPFTSFCATM